MPTNQLYLRSITSPYNDITRGATLSYADVDNNFVMLKGLSIVSATTSGDTALLTRYNGNIITFPVVVSSIINTNYSDLFALYSASTLTSGQFYCITDYATIHNIRGTSPTVIHSGSTEPLILLATATNTLYHQAYSTAFTQDIIYYDITGGDVNDTSFFNSGTTITNLKGIIYYREDTKQNVSCYYDFRNIVRDILGTKTFTDYSTVYNFKLGPLFVGQVGTIISNNVFGSNSKNNLIGSNFYNNVVGSNFQNNEIHDNTCNSINFSGATLVYQPFNKTITSMYSVSLGTAVKLWYLDADSNLPIFANITD